MKTKPPIAPSAPKPSLTGSPPTPTKKVSSRSSATPNGASRDAAVSKPPRSSSDIPDFKTFDIISKHESRLKREYSSTLKDVTGIIGARIALEEALMKEAVIIRRADRLNKKETNFQAIGFDLSIAQVDLVINRENAFIRAKKVVFPPRTPNSELFRSAM